MQPSPSNTLSWREIANPISYFLHNTDAFMAESAAFVFRMDISGAQSTVCRSYQDIIWTEGFGRRLVYKVLGLCVIADRLNIMGCHIWG